MSVHDSHWRVVRRLGLATLPVTVCATHFELTSLGGWPGGTYCHFLRAQMTTLSWTVRALRGAGPRVAGYKCGSSLKPAHRIHVSTALRECLRKGCYLFRPCLRRTPRGTPVICP